jgi:short subunit dehydrogenase-like uncharacterized protein
MTDILIYGATGYTGGLCAEHAAGRGLSPILAGRNADRVVELAVRLGLEARSFSLNDPVAIAKALVGVSTVLNCAGPFSATARPMVEACLAAGVHYVDVTGEIDVFEALAAKDAEAEGRGVALLPGAGFDVVPSDCLAAHVASRLPGATRLKLSIGGFGGLGSASRGTAKTMLEAIGDGCRARRGGRIVTLDVAPPGVADFGDGPRPTVGVSWGDVSTAFRSTSVPDIDVAFEATPPMRRAAAMPGFARRIVGSAPVRRALNRLIQAAMPPGPSEDDRLAGRSLIVAEAWDAAGRHAVSRLVAPEAYRLTAWTAVETARRVAAGQCPPGYQTPSTAFGADFILSFDEVERIDIS